jgi:hypothetical protein
MLRWFESDGTTPLGSLAFGVVGPGEDYFTKNGDYLQVVVKNVGDATVTDVLVEIQPVGSYALNEFLHMATGVSSPGAFVDITDDPLELGSLTAGQSAKVWFDLIVPLYAVRGRGQYASVRAYGSGS